MDQATVDGLAGAAMPGSAAVAGLIVLVAELAAAGVLTIEAADHIRTTLLADAEQGGAPFLQKTAFKQGVTRQFLRHMPDE